MIEKTKINKSKNATLKYDDEIFFISTFIDPCFKMFWLDYLKINEKAKSSLCSEIKNLLIEKCLENAKRDLINTEEQISAGRPVERLFSVAGYIIRPHRAKITTSNLEKSTLLKANFFLLNQ